jgi:subtilase family serine protease
MTIKTILMAGVIVAMSITQPQARGMKNRLALIKLPDLVVMEVSTTDFDNVKVRVKNQGAAPSSSCYLALTIKPTDGTPMKVFSPKVSALKPGQQTVVTVKTNFLQDGNRLSQAEFEALVDRSETVKESNETNNTRTGQFGNYKP